MINLLFCILPKLNFDVLMSIRIKAINYFQNNRVLQHALFWITFLFLYTPRGMLAYETPFFEVFIYYCFVTIFQILASYFLAYYIIPNFLLKKRYVLALVFFLMVVYISSIGYEIVNIYFYIPLFKEVTFKQTPVVEILTDWRNIFKGYPSLFSNVLIFLFVKFFLSYKKKQERDLLLSKEKTENQLKALKAQLNPNFLFNTLNSIYTLSLNESPKTSESIGKLSKVLDYVLYHCDDKFVLLSNEIELLNNYISLEKFRYDDRLQISFINEIENDKEIPPLILLSLVENTFKLLTVEDSGSSKIDILVSNTEDGFVFKISNMVSKDYQYKNDLNIELLNIKKQLDLIYKNTYNLKIENSKSNFTIVLEIQNIEINK